MKKNTLVLLFILSITSLYAQIFHKGNTDSEFINLKSSGITYIKTGDEVFDGAVLQALKEYWKVTPFKVKEKNAPFNDDDVVLFSAILSTYNGYNTFKENVMGVVTGSYIKQDKFTKMNTIGFISMNGFNQKQSTKDIKAYIGYVIRGLNDCILTIKTNNVVGSGLPFYRGVSNSINPSVKGLKTKTLLIVGETKELVKIKDLNKSGIKYKMITEQEFQEMSKVELAKYYLLYFGVNSYTVVSIYEASTKKIVFTHYYMSAHALFDSKDTKRILKQFL